MTIESQVKVLESVVSKIDTSIEKITQVSNDIGKLLAVHDERINTIEKVNNRMDTEVRDLHSRITTTTREICDKIDQMELLLEAKLKEHSDNSIKQNKELLESNDLNMINLKNRIEVLERWRWFVLGAAACIGYLIANAKTFIN